MEEGLDEQKCPSRPITHAFPLFNTTRDRNGSHRSAHCKHYIKDDRNIRFTPELDPEERYLQKQLRYAKCSLNQTCPISLHRIRINREQKHIWTQGELVITTNFSVTLKCHKYDMKHAQIAEKMERWSSQKLIRMTVSSHQEDNRKHDCTKSST